GTLRFALHRHLHRVRDRTGGDLDGTFDPSGRGHQGASLMAVTGKPGISTPREASREVRNAVDAIRARLEALEKLLNTTELSAGAAFQSNQKSNASISFLQSQINV